MTPEQLREGIFALNTRRFGTVAEILVKRLRTLGKARNQFHDLYDHSTGRRVEVKFSRAMREATERVTDRTVLACIEAATSEKRLIHWADRHSVAYDCNIQQVKPTEFEVLEYGVFFADRIAFFRITSAEIGPEIGFSDRQHKGNVGEGQFHIDEQSIAVHEARWLVGTMSYAEALETLEDIRASAG